MIDPSKGIWAKILKPLSIIGWILFGLVVISFVWLVIWAVIWAVT